LQRKKRTAQSILPADPAQLKRKLVIALDQGLKRSDINIEWLRKRVPIHWGGMSDPFQPCENYYKVTKQWLELP
jgi:DNA repair photolyase